MDSGPSNRPNTRHPYLRRVSETNRDGGNRLLAQDDVPLSGRDADQQVMKTTTQVECTALSDEATDIRCHRRGPESLEVTSA